MGLLRRAPTTRSARIVRPSGRGLTASATSARRGRGGLKPLNQAWQTKALGFYDTVGECWYPAQFYARAMQRIRFYPALLDDKGDPQEITDGPVLDLFEQIQDPGGGGRSVLAKNYGQLRFLIGDGYLVVSEEDGEEAWEYLSPLELRVDPRSSENDPQKYRRYRAQGAEAENLTEAEDSDFGALTGTNVRVYRLYRRHPSYSRWADSPVRAVLDLYELLFRLTLAAGGESLSRAIQRGGFFWPDELSIEPLTPEEVADDEDPEQDIVVAHLRDIYARALQNPGSAESAMPVIVRGPGVIEKGNGVIPTKDALGYFPMGPPDVYAEGDMWDKTISRLAGGLDMPREMVDVKGLGATNHWAGWLLDEQGFRQHVAGVVEEFCIDVNAAYLRPAAIDAGVKNADRVVIWYDPAAAINHPDEIKTARDGYLDGVLSPRYYRDKAGATDRDKPTQEELDLLLEILSKGSQGQLPRQQAGETSPGQGGRGGDVVEQPPDQPPSPPPAEDRQLQAARILGASQFAVGRARELAGRRLARRSQSCPHCMERIHGVPRALVAATLGADQVREVLDGHASEAELVAGAGRELAETLEALGINGGWPVRLGTLVEEHALRTLYEPVVPVLPSGFANAVARALQ